MQRESSFGSPNPFWLSKFLSSTICLALYLSIFTGQSMSLGGLLAQTSVRTLEVPDEPEVRLQLSELYRIGSLDGEYDAFGRIMDVRFDRSGRLMFADDLNHRVAVFSPSEGFLAFLGRKGEGPGEFQSPWVIGVGDRDSIFIWDFGLARVSVFGPDLAYSRSFAVPPNWMVSTISFMPNGNLLLAAYGSGEQHALHILDREGRSKDHFGRTVHYELKLGGMEGNLLGGTVAINLKSMVFSNKSPYEIDVFDLRGIPVRQCKGDEAWTTPPESVVEISDARIRLHWDRFVHSFRIIGLPGGLFLNTILDPLNDRTMYDVVDQECRLLARGFSEHSIMWMDSWEDLIVGVRNLNYPEVVIYKLKIE